MRRIRNNIISVIISLIRLIVFKLYMGNNIDFSWVERISPNVVMEFNKNSKVFFGKKVRIHSGSKVKVRNNGHLSINDNVKINYNCMIICHEKIVIGEGTEFGPMVLLYDHDHDYEVGLQKEQYKSAPIVIGNNCWIGANTVILKGTVLGNGCIVGAGSVISGNYPDGSRIVQKRKTEVRDIDYYSER